MKFIGRWYFDQCAENSGIRAGILDGREFEFRHKQEVFLSSKPLRPPLEPLQQPITGVLSRRQGGRSVNLATHLPLSGFGGLEVACWPLVPKFAGSNPAEAVGFLRVNKNPQHVGGHR